MIALNHTLKTLALASMLMLATCAPRPEEVRAETSPSSVSESQPVSTVDIEPPPPSRQMLLDSGAVYFRNCAICHGNNGRGGRGPAVANVDYVMADRTRLIRTVLAGVKDSIRVNGVRWKTGEMLGWGETWDDFKIAAVLTYVRAALNDSLVTSCVPENFETGTWASCETVPRTPEDIASDSVAVDDVAEVRRTLNLGPK